MSFPLFSHPGKLTPYYLAFPLLFCLALKTIHNKPEYKKTYLIWFIFLTVVDLKLSLWFQVDEYIHVLHYQFHRSSQCDWSKTCAGISQCCRNCPKTMSPENTRLCCDESAFSCLEQQRYHWWTIFART